MILTVLARVFSTNDGQPLADRRSDHEGVGRTQAVLVRLGQREVLKVQSELAHVGRLLDGHLAGVSSVVAPRVAGIHKGGLVLVGFAAAGELVSEGVVLVF